MGKKTRKQKLDFGTLSPLEQLSSHIPGTSALDSTFRFLSLNEDIGAKDGDPYDSETVSNGSSDYTDSDSETSTDATSDTENEHTSGDDTSASSSRYTKFTV